MKQNNGEYAVRVVLGRAPVILSSVVAMIGITGCFDDEGPPPSEEKVLEEVLDGVWCATIDTAQADTDPPGQGPYPKEIKDSRGQYPMYCDCAPDESVYNELLLLQSGGVAVVTASDSDPVEAFRDHLFEKAVEACETLYMTDFATQMPAPDTHNCATQLVTGTSEITMGTGSCYILRSYSLETGDESDDGGDDEAGNPLPEDHWSDYYTLNNVITYNSSTAAYEIDDTFFYDLLDNPAWLIGDSAYIALDGTDWKLYGVVSGTVAHALGLQTGDIPLTLNSYDVTTPEDALSAYTALLSSTSFTLVVRRGTANVTLDYDLI